MPWENDGMDGGGLRWGCAIPDTGGAWKLDSPLPVQGVLHCTSQDCQAWLSS